MMKTLSFLAVSIALFASQLALSGRHPASEPVSISLQHGTYVVQVYDIQSSPPAALVVIQRPENPKARDGEYSTTATFKVRPLGDVYLGGDEISDVAVIESTLRAQATDIKLRSEFKVDESAAQRKGVFPSPPPMRDPIRFRLPKAVVDVIRDTVTRTKDAPVYLKVIEKATSGLKDTLKTQV